MLRSESHQVGVGSLALQLEQLLQAHSVSSLCCLTQQPCTLRLCELLLLHGRPQLRILLSAQPLNRRERRPLPLSLSHRIARPHTRSVVPSRRCPLRREQGTL
uniref:Uncharacterized protein n=1 Tax=Haptolina brevifila TaxID=156173 RepID=A0A7S2NHM9_9EUKA